MIPQKLPLVALTAVLAFAPAASAEDQSGTLKKIADSGVISLGFHESTPPFTYSAGDGKPMGYSYDFALKIAEAVRRELNRPKL